MKKILVFMLAAVMSVLLIGTAVFADEDLSDEELYEEEYTDDYDYELISEDVQLISVDAQLSEDGEYTVGDYSEIEIPSYLVNISDEDVSNYIDSILEYATTQEQITEGVVEDGDSVNIDFSGCLAGEDEPFDGGTAQGYDIVIGSGTFIEGFEEQIIGHEVGETFDVNVTFPEEYTEELAGKDAVFEVTVNYILETVKPELNDDFVKDFSVENLKEELSSVDELKEYTYNYLYKNNLQNAIMDSIVDLISVTSYPEADFNLMKAYSAESLDYYVSMYASMGMGIEGQDDLAQMYGYESADDYTNDEAMYYMDMILLLDTIAKDNGIEVTDEEVDAAVADYIKSYGMSDVYTVEEFKELSGEAWVKLLESLQVKYEKVMEVLEPNVVIVEETDIYSDYYEDDAEIAD